ncbi:MAG: tetratricopeptide repeat protein, partial [Pseudomonadota bacterium]
FVPVSLPLPGAFDHVLVRANIGGNLYYLDGTSLGANLTTVGNVPNFEYALPIRASGGDIEPIKQVLPRAPDTISEVSVDATAGIDLPTLVTMTVNLFGPSAAQFSAAAEKLTDDRKRQMARRMNSNISMVDLEIIPGEDDSVSTMVLTGIANTDFQFTGLRGEVGLGMFAGSMRFSPNRSRREWRDIPVSNMRPRSTTMTVNLKLPENIGEFELRDAEPVDVEIAGRRYTRSIKMDGNTVSATENLIGYGGETSPEIFREERRKSAALARQKPRLVASEDAPRIWRYATQKDRSALEPLEKAYAQLIANDPDEMMPYITRAAFRYDTYDFAGSLEDMNKVVELEPTAEFYGQRSTVHSMLGNHDAEQADLEEAYALDPTPARAMDLAGTLALRGKLEEARDILEYEDGDEGVREELAVSLAELDALEGDSEGGLLRISDMLLDKPNDGYLLNEQCWFMGVWNIDLEEGLAVCKKAVENSDNTASAIDSRAMMFLRNGMFEEAKADVKAALELNPNQAASILLRGLIRLEEGDKGGQADIDDALARDPSMRETYRLWGFDI